MAAQDVEMAVSKGNVSPNISDTCAFAFENYLGVSVPSGDKRNRHTWVMDKTVVDSLTTNALPAWNSFWTGTNPKQWFGGVASGVKRVFHVSKDADGANRLWEGFTADRLDNGLPITSFLETKTHIDYSAKATGLDQKKFLYAEITFAEMYGDVSATVYWAGTRGRYKKIAEFDFVATEGELRNDGVSIPMGQTIYSLRPQTRRVRTPSIDTASLARSDCSTCGVESSNTDNVDIGFSLLIVWSGRAGVSSYRIFADPEQERSEGNCTPREIEETNEVKDSLCQSSFPG